MIVERAASLRGHGDLEPDAVRKAWNRALLRLADLFAEPRRAWMVSALAVPGLAEHLRAGKPVRLPSGERQVRALLTGLRASGRPEWRWVPERPR